ncbi:MAG: response regulator transcription factor [Methylobacteriaceae bacterium]|nr:response regulator transcription factor [Methylobacteriaceae bacterium]
MSAERRIVHVIDDDPALSEALCFLFRSRGVEPKPYLSGEAFLAAAPTRGCVLLDVRMSGMSGLEVFERLCAAGAQLPVIFLSGHADVPMAVEALKKGARDFVVKPFNDNDLVDRVLAVLAADDESRAARERRDTVAHRLATLSERERQVMELMLAGRMNKVIADELGIAMRTVEVHRARALEKMGVRSAVELANLLAAARG